MSQFPSLDWFESLRTTFNECSEYHGAGGGRCDCVAGVKAGRHCILLTFEDLSCISCEPVKHSDLDQADFYVEMPLVTWNKMLNNIAHEGHATGEYTLNALDLGNMEGIVKSTHNDQYRQDLFIRFNQTIQNFFDASSRMNPR